MSHSLDIQTSSDGNKRQKRSKFGRSELRSVTRTSHRTKKNDKIHYNERTIHNNNNNNNDNNDNDNDNDLESEDDVEDDYEDDEDIEKNTIASKRSNKKENKMAYSALVTLLKSKHDIEELKNSLKSDEKFNDINNDENNPSDNSLDNEFVDAQEDILNDEEKIQDNLDVNNKFDSFNLHFNQEDKISAIIDKYESLPIKDKRIKLISKEEIKSADNDNDDKYIKYRYGFPIANPKIIENINTGLTLDQKLKYHNVKKKVQDKFLEFEETSKLDIELIESMLTYQTINFQYLNNEIIKSKYQDFYLLHSINHLLKTRDRILNNNEKKSLYEKKLKESIDDNEIEPEFRDQGYTRPKILILLPSRNFAYKVVDKLIKILKMENIENKKKFKTQFFDDSKITDRVYHSKPKDFEEYFDGNTSDLFVLGIKYTRKTLKLYSPLEQSDIIIASPLGLLKLYNKIEARKNSKFNKKNDKNDKENDGMKNNFLSSIEICVIDKAEGMMMQNWSNVTEILKNHLNQTPKDFINVDFSRIRMWAINGQNEFLTQFLCFDKFATPEMISIVKNSKNLLSGSTSYIPIESMSLIDSTNYKLYKLGLINKFERLKQVFMRFEFDEKSIINEPIKRFEFFKNVVLPQIINKSSYKYGTLIYIPSYFDYLRIKKYLKDESSLSFVAIDEYSSNSKLTRSRALFKNKSNQATIMLYTERLHFYKRFDIKGVRNLIFYQLPSDPDFYQQVLEFIANEKLRINAEKSKIKVDEIKEKNNDEDDEDEDDEEEEEDLDLNLCMIRSIYSKLDVMRFSNIVGNNNVNRLVHGENEIIEFS